MKKKPAVPRFKNSEEERKFWDKLDLSDYFDSGDFESVSFPNLKPTSRAISIRLPEAMLLRLKEKANELHIPYQTLIKQFVAEGIRGDSRRKAA